MKVNGLDASYYYAQDFDRAVSFYTTMIGTPPPTLVPGMFAEWEFKGGEAFGLYKGSQPQSRNYVRAACTSPTTAKWKTRRYVIWRSETTPRATASSCTSASKAGPERR